MVWKERLEAQFQLLVQHGNVLSLDEGMSTERSGIVITFDDGYEDFYEYTFPLLMKYALPATVFVSTSKTGKVIFEQNYGQELGYMNQEQLRSMARSGLVSVESHGHTHRRLDSLMPKLQKKEIWHSFKALTELLGSCPKHFCYPYGAFDSYTKRVLAYFGFRSACTTVNGVNSFPLARYELRRLPVDSHMTPMDFASIIPKNR